MKFNEYLIKTTKIAKEEKSVGNKLHKIFISNKELDDIEIRAAKNSSLHPTICASLISTLSLYFTYNE